MFMVLLVPAMFTGAARSGAGAGRGQDGVGAGNRGVDDGRGEARPSTLEAHDGAPSRS